MPLILFIEDEKSLSTLVTKKLEGEGFKVEVVADGETGFKKALELKPDLILLDIILPKTDGIILLKKLRKENEWGSKVPVILLTNLDPSSQEMNQAITETHPVYYMIKADWKLEDVIEKVKEVLADR